MAKQARPKKLVVCTFCGKQCWKRLKRKVNRCNKCVLAYQRERWPKVKAKLDSGKWCREHKAERRAYMARWRDRNRANVRRMARLWARKNYAKNKQILADADAICGACGDRHDEAGRERILRRLLPANAHEIREAWTCVWGDPSEDDAGARKLYRDLERIGAKKYAGEWMLPRERRAA